MSECKHPGAYKTYESSVWRCDVCHEPVDITKTPEMVAEIETLTAKLQAAEARIAILTELADDYATHDSWRCGYYDECHCGLNELQKQSGLEPSPCGYNKQEPKP